MVDFQFIFIALLYFVIIYFVHIQLRKLSLSSTLSIPTTVTHTAETFKQQPTNEQMFEQQTIQNSLADTMVGDNLEQFDNFKSLFDNEDSELGTEWSKVYEQTQLDNKDKTVTVKSNTTLDPEYSKTTLLDDTSVMNPSSEMGGEGLRAYDTFDGAVYQSFSGL
jgi:hypothetical protein